MKRTFLKLPLVLLLPLVLTFSACDHDVDDMVEDYNEHCGVTKKWVPSTSSSSTYRYDASLLIPEDSYTVAQDETKVISLSCIQPSNWYLKDENGDEVNDPADAEYTYASVYFNTGRITVPNKNLKYNSSVIIRPSLTGLPSGTYTLSVMVWFADYHLEDSAVLIITD